MHTLGRMPKGVQREMFKAPALHTNKHPLLSNSNKHTDALAHIATHSYSVHKCLDTDTPLVPYASVPANYKRSNQFHRGPRPGKSTSMTPATWLLSLYLTAAYTQAETKPASSLLLSTAGTTIQTTASYQAALPCA